MAIQRNPVKSSALNSIGYDPSTKTLEVEMSSGIVYRYKDVPPEAHRDLIGAESVGGHFAEKIRTQYEYERVPTDNIED